jgi:Tfp pilus assembly protein PilV
VSTGERGESLIEVVVAAAIVAISLGALLGASLAAAHRFGPDPVQTALQRGLQQEMRIAADLLKYQGGTIAPAAVATAIPMPSGSPLPVHLSIATVPLAGGGTAVTLDATSDADPNESFRLQSTIAAPAPLPGSSVTSPGAAGSAPN